MKHIAKIYGFILTWLPFHLLYTVCCISAKAIHHSFERNIITKIIMGHSVNTVSI